MRGYHLALAMFLAAGAAEAYDEKSALTHLGFLTCSLAVASNASDVDVQGPLRQTREMLCAFAPGGEGPEETYSGTFQSISQDQRDSESPVMIWSVKGTSSMLGTPGFLQQLYTIDVGAAPGRITPLIGETNSSVMLEAMTENSGTHIQPRATSILVALRLRSTPT
jgi:hypothetical protein